MIFVVAAALKDEEGRYLICQRPSHKSMAGYWEFPGGKLDAGESPETALVRELAEELSIQVELSDLLPLTFVSYAYPDFHLFMPLYEICRWKGQIQNLEHADIRWVHPGDMMSYKMLPADVPLVQFLMEKSNC